MEKHTILVIEDDPSIRDILKLALEFEGYGVALASNGKEGLLYLETMPLPNMILLDLMMPIMNGWEFMEIFKEQDKFKHIPVLIVSAFSEKAKTIEATAFIPKPVELETLINSIREYI